MYPISFKAKKIMPTYIKQHSNGQSKNKEVTFVELERNNIQDLRALGDIAGVGKGSSENDWNTMITRGIYNTFIDYQDMNKSHVNAITTQKGNFEKLDSSKVLGIILYTNDELMYKNHNLTYVGGLQTNPLYINPKKHSSFVDLITNFFTKKKTSQDSEEKTYSHIGEKLLQCTESQSPNKYIGLRSVPTAMNFYKHLGYKNPYNDNFMIKKIN